MSTLETGQSVGRYKILRFLGAGAMGEVYLAEDPQIERRLAIKTVRLAGRPEEVDDRKKRLLREARAAGRMLHPNIVTLFDAGEAEGMLFLAFEFVEGTDLAARVGLPARLTLREVLRIGRYVAEALEYAHRQGIVHRDIKPGNVLLDDQGRVKVTDFGIAKVAGQATELTMAGSVLGSPQYLSPEQIRGEELDGRSDIFSLGVLLYEILSRKRPFEGDTLTSLVYSILTKEPPPISELRAVPLRLEALLARMLAKDREERTATAAEVARELAAIELELAEETLLAPAGGDPVGPTTVLPRSPSTGSPARSVAPPPPPLPLASPSTKMTARETPPPSWPPPPPPAGNPPPPAWSAAPETAATPREPAPPAPAAAPVYGAPARSGPPRALIVIGVLGLLLVIGAGAGWFLAQRLGLVGNGEQTEKTAGQDELAPPGAGTTEGSLPSGPANPGETVTPSGVVAGAPVSPSGAPKETQIGPAAAPPNRQVPPAVVSGSATGTAPGTQGREVPRNGAPPVVPVPIPPPAQRQPVVEEPAPAPSRPAEPAEEEEKPKPRGNADRTIATGLQVTFNVEPPDAIVVVDRTVLGQAAEWAGGKRGKVYTLPGADSYRVRIKKDGMRDAVIDLEAGERAGVTPITVRMRPLAGAGADSTDLATYRTSSAIALRVDAPGATFTVDGRPQGATKRYSGGFGGSGWLVLPAGKHRISVSAPGFQQQDLIVDVTGSAGEDKLLIPLRLTPGG